MADAPGLRPPRLRVDLAAIAHNYRLLAARAAPGQCGACVKADAYGLGLEPVVRALWAAGCREFFVATGREGLRLLDALPAARAWVLDGYLPAEAALYAHAGLAPALNDLDQVRAWQVAHGTRTAALQIDTGMARLGLTPGELDALLGAPELATGLRGALLVSHLACADDPHDARNAAQRERFEAARVALGAPRASLAATSGLFLGPAYRYDLARPGAGLFGVNPQAGQANPLRAAVQLRAPVLQVREVSTATGVGYGATFQATPPGRIGALGVGYADGYPRAAGNRAHARIAGHTVPVVGRVSMDVVTVDLSALPADAVRPGDWASLLDEDYGVDALAAAAGTIGYEILTRLGQACTREWVGTGTDAAAAD